MKFVHDALSVVLSLLLVATPSTYASSTRSTKLSSNKKTTNAIYAGYCLGCAAWPAKHDFTTDDKTTKQLMQPINSYQLHLPSKIKAQIYPPAFIMIQHKKQQTQQKKRETRLLLLSAPPVANKSSTTENTVTETSSNVQPPIIIEESTSDDGGPIYTNKQIFLSIVVLGVAASALSNKKQQQQQRQLSEESSNKNILQIKKRIIFNNLEVDISENNDMDDVLEIELVPTYDDDSVLTITPKSINENSSSSNSPPAYGVMEQLLKSLSPNSWNSEHRRVNIFRDVNPNSTTIENTEDDNVSQTSSMLGISMLLKRMAFNKAFNKWDTQRHDTILRTDDHISHAADEIALIEEAKEEEEEEEEEEREGEEVDLQTSQAVDTIADEDDTEVWYHVGSGRIVSAREARAVLAAEGHPSYQVDDANDTKDTVEMAATPTINIVATTQRRVIFPELESQLEEYKYQYNF
jgi:hypothetical protein